MLSMLRRSFWQSGLTLGLLLLTPLTALAKPWKGGELITRQTFEFGAFEARILAARGSGMITPFFLWKNNSEVRGVPWQEQDFEIFGANGAYQTQIMTPGDGEAHRTEHVIYHSLPTPAWERYYTYRIEWTPQYIAFYLDGELVRKETDVQEYAQHLNPNLAEPAQLRVSLWAGDNPWSSAFDASAVPAATFVNWIQVYSYTPGRGPSGSDFTPQWRDDFDRLDGNRWWTANWTFDVAINDYIAQNITTRDGKLVIAFTAENATGQFPAPPEDAAFSNLPPEGGSSTCNVNTTYAARNMRASTGAATSDGWNLWSNGTLSTDHSFKTGENLISVTARGQAAAGQWPHLTLLVDNRPLGEATVDGSTYESYDFVVNVPPGAHQVSVRFDNDYYQNGEDRNLYVADVSVAACSD